jgi:HlyD family secretion protein
MRTALIALFVILIPVVGVAYYVTRAAANSTPKFRTVVVQRADLTATIGATGTVEPEEVVDVGSQVAGRIVALGNDVKRSTPASQKTIDYTSVVEQGTELALIDDAVYKAQRDQAQASLSRAEADLLQAEANVSTAEAKLTQADAEWKRAQHLRPDMVDTDTDSVSPTSHVVQEPAAPVRRTISDTDFVLAKANYLAARAGQKAATANVAVTQAAVDQAHAVLELAETNLGYTVIKSPVQGVIIDRRVNIGQTVVASLNAPSLFLIAKDLTRMQVWASVNEADIGRLRSRPEIPVEFTVDAYPDEVFHGKVAQIRFNAMMTQNVVTFTVVVSTDNADLKLIPYLTANLQFEIETHNNVLQVPQSALRWRPRAELLPPELRDKQKPDAGSSGDKGKANFAARKAGDQQPAAGAAKSRTDHGRVWVQDGNYVRPIEVQIGISDGSQTEISGEGIEAGMQVVVGEVRVEEESDVTNPFMPKLMNQRPKVQP